MRVLLVSDFYPPAPGGLEAHVRRLAHALCRRGHNVHVVTSGRSTSDTMDGPVPVTTRPSAIARFTKLYASAARPFPPPWRDPEVSSAIVDVASRFKPDVVHAHGWSAFSVPDVAPLVVTLHDHGLRCPKKTLLRQGAECGTGIGMPCLTCSSETQGMSKRLVFSSALSRATPRLAKQARLFLAVSTSVRDRALEGGLDPGGLAVVPNFLDLPDETPSPLPLSPTFLYVGPGDAHKGRGVLLDAFARLTAGSSRLIVVGDGAVETHHQGVEFRGRLSGEPLWKSYREASLLVVPSIWPEPCPTVVLEAFGRGRPVVGSRIGGLTDLVENGRSGALVPPNDAAALARDLARLAADRPLLERLSSGAFQRASDFTGQAVVPQIEMSYAKAIGLAA